MTIQNNTSKMNKSCIKCKGKLHKIVYDYKYMVIVLNATFNTISVISWRSVLLVEKTENTAKTTDLS